MNKLAIGTLVCCNIFSSSSSIKTEAVLSDFDDCAVILRAGQLAALEGAIVHQGSYKWAVCIETDASASVRRNLIEK